MRRLLTLIELLCLPAPRLAQHVTVQWLPPSPRQGAFSYVLVHPPADDSVQAVRGALDGVDKRAAVLDALDQIQRTSLDFYATIRSLYRQRRIDEINNGEQPEGRPGRSIISGKEPPAPVADHDAAPLDDVADKSQL